MDFSMARSNEKKAPEIPQGAPRARLDKDAAIRAAFFKACGEGVLEAMADMAGRDPWLLQDRREGLDALPGDGFDAAMACGARDHMRCFEWLSERMGPGWCFGRDAEGRPLATMMARAGNLAALEIMRKSGARVDVGEDPHALAETALFKLDPKLLEVVEGWLPAGALADAATARVSRVEGGLSGSVEIGDAPEFLRQAASRAMPLEGRNSKGSPMLHVFAQASCEASVVAWLALGADPFLGDAEGMRASQRARGLRCRSLLFAAEERWVLELDRPAGGEAHSKGGIRL